MMTLADDFRYVDVLKKDPIDRDRDGKVYDGTKRERPALPSEMMPDVRARMGLGSKKKKGGMGRPAKGKAPEKRAGAKAPAPKKQAMYLVHWESPEGDKRDKLFPDKEDALDFARARNRGGAKNVGAFPEGHPKYKENENLADRSRLPKDDVADGNLEDMRGMPQKGQLPDGGRAARDRANDKRKERDDPARAEWAREQREKKKKPADAAIDRINDENREARDDFKKPDEGTAEFRNRRHVKAGEKAYRDEQNGERLVVPRKRKDESESEFTERKRAWQQGYNKAKPGPDTERQMREQDARKKLRDRKDKENDDRKVRDDPARAEWAKEQNRKAGVRGEEDGERNNAGPPKNFNAAEREEWQKGFDRGRAKQRERFEEGKKRQADKDKRNAGGADNDPVRRARAQREEDKGKGKYLVEQVNGEFGWEEVYEFDNEDDAFDFMDREDVRNVGRETAALSGRIVKPGDKDYDGLKGKAKKPNTKQLNTGPGTRNLEQMVGGRERGRNRKLDAENRQPHFVQHANGDVDRYDNKLEADAAARAENARLFQAANGRRGGAGRNGRFDGARNNRAQVFGPRDKEYKNFQGIDPKNAKPDRNKRIAGQTAFEEAAGEPMGAKKRMNERPWNEVPKAQRHIGADGKRMVLMPADEGGGLAPWRGNQKVARDAKGGGVGRRINEQGQRDLLGNALPKPKRKPKFQIRENKGGAGGRYKVIGRDEDGQKREFPVPNREIGMQVKQALLAGREPVADDFLNDFDRAARDRRLNDKKIITSARAEVKDGGVPKMPDGYVGFDPQGKKRGANNPDNPKNEPHLAMYFDEHGKHVRNFDNQRDALEFMFMRNANGKGHKDDSILGPKDDFYTLNMAQGHGKDGMYDRHANAAMLRLEESKAKDNELKRAELAAKKKMAEAKVAEPSKAVDPWVKGDAYQMGDIVEHDGNRWQAKANLGYGEKPGDGKWKKLDSTGDAAAPDAGGPPGGPPNTDKIRRFNRYADDLHNAIGENNDQLDLGGTNNNELAKHWMRAVQAAANGDKDKYEMELRWFFKREGKADNPTDIQDKIDDLLEQVDADVLGHAFDNVRGWGDEEGDTKGYMLDAMRKKWKKDPGPDGLKASTTPPSKMGNGYNAKAIAAHFEAGGSISDAPAGDVREYILAHPERFKVMPNGKKGVSPNDWVIDNQIDTGIEVTIPEGKFTADGHYDGINWVKTRGEVWVMKGSAVDFNNKRGMKDDVLNEIIGQNLQEQLGVASAGARWATPGDHVGAFKNGKKTKQPFVLQKHLAQDVETPDVDPTGERMVAFVAGDVIASRRGKGVGIDKWEKGSSYLDNLEDPGQLMELGVIDFLIQNHDRHPGNWSGMLRPDGKVRIGIYDNGYGLGATESYGHINDADSFFARTNYAGSNISKGARAFKDRRAARKRFMEIIEKANEFDMDAALQRLRDGGVTGDDYKEAKHQLNLMRKRIDNLYKNRETIAERWA